MWIPYEVGPLETTINQIFEEALLYYKGGNTLSNYAKCDCLYELMKKYGLLDTDCSKWRFKITALKSWELFVKHFTNHIKYLDTHTTDKDSRISCCQCCQDGGYAQRCNLRPT